MPIPVKTWQVILVKKIAYLEHDQTDARDSQLNITAVGVFAVVEADAIHFEALGVLQKIDLCLRGRLALVELVELTDSSLNVFCAQASIYVSCGVG